MESREERNELVNSLSLATVCVHMIIFHLFSFPSSSLSLIVWERLPFAASFFQLDAVATKRCGMVVDPY